MLGDHGCWISLAMTYDDSAENKVQLIQAPVWSGRHVPQDSSSYTYNLHSCHRQLEAALASTK